MGGKPVTGLKGGKRRGNGLACKTALNWAKKATGSSKIRRTKQLSGEGKVLKLKRGLEIELKCVVDYRRKGG